MLQRIRNYVHERRRGISMVAGVVGGFYLVGQYVMNRLEEMREQVVQDRAARENLRRRFQQNQQDVSYTIMALLPTLSERVLKDMDVEAVTKELQTKSRGRRRPDTPDQTPSESSLASSVELLHGQDTHSDMASVSGTSATGQDDQASPSRLTASSQSWVDEFGAQSSVQGPTLSMPSELTSDNGSPRSTRENYLSDSVTSDSVISTSDVERSRVRRAERGELDAGVSITRNKAELWREVKILTVTRTLTIIYSTTLLSLLTHIQLNLLGRAKYVQSVVQLQRDEKTREQREFDSSISSLFFGPQSDFSDPVDSRVEALATITEGSEMKFLTLSWWLLHVGWKDVGERVRRSVEEVFEGVSLKSKVGSMELHRLVCDVRRRVEHEITYEGTERKINFLSTLIPPTSETLQHVLVQGGLPPTLVASFDPAFASLLEETRSIVASPAFARVLELCLDRATEILFDGLRKNVFVDETFGEDPAGERDGKIRLAGMLPGLARWSHLALNGFPNELVDGLADIREMTGFAAIIYSSYDNLVQ